MIKRGGSSQFAPDLSRRGERSCPRVKTFRVTPALPTAGIVDAHILWPRWLQETQRNWTVLLLLLFELLFPEHRDLSKVTHSAHAHAPAKAAVASVSTWEPRRAPFPPATGMRGTD